MATITISQLSQRAFESLQEEAARESLKLEVVATRHLERTASAGAVRERRSAADLLTLARAIRRIERATVFTPEFIRAARDYGRA